MYCTKCRNISEKAERCPVCGSRRVREPLPEDICFLTETAPIAGDMLRDVLEQEGIPVLCQSTLGAGLAMTVGSMFERLKVFVRYDSLERAREIAEELFSSDGETEK